MAKVVSKEWQKLVMLMLILWLSLPSGASGDGVGAELAGFETGGRGGSTISAVLRDGAGAGNGAGPFAPAEIASRNDPGSAGRRGNSRSVFSGSEHGFAALFSKYCW